jgi:outer membrane immunogenic protein
MIPLGLTNRQGVVIMKKSLLGGLVLSLTMGGAAMAADMAVKARPYVAPAFSWTGCYIGVEGGGAWGRSKHSGVTAPGFGTVGDFTPYFNLSGGLVGGETGCNAQIGDSTWVMGAEFDMSWTNKKGSSAETGLGSIIAGTTAGVDETKERWISTSRVRIGPTWGPLWGYVTGGFAAASVRATVTPPFSATSFDDTKTLYGWAAGLGFEYAWWQFWSVKVEYLYARFENRVFFDIPPLPVATRTLNIDDHIVRVGLNWRWGGLGKSPVVAAY